MQVTCNMKTNQYKEKIKAYISKNHLVSMSDISKNISDANFSTIFRNVEQMVQDGELKRIVLDKDVIKYESANHSHNHFVCDECGDVDEVEVTLADKSRKVRDVVVRGVCDKCDI